MKNAALLSWEKSAAIHPLQEVIEFVELTKSFGNTIQSETETHFEIMTIRQNYLCLYCELDWLGDAFSAGVSSGAIWALASRLLCWLQTDHDTAHSEKLQNKNKRNPHHTYSGVQLNRLNIHVNPIVRFFHFFDERISLEFVFRFGKFLWFYDFRNLKQACQHKYSEESFEAQLKSILRGIFYFVNQRCYIMFAYDISILKDIFLE